MLTGIPDYDLPKEVVRRGVALMKDMGAKFVTGCSGGADITGGQMMEQVADAVFIGTGTSVSRVLYLPSKELEGVIQSSYLLRMNALHNEGQLGRDAVPVKPGDRVLVIGAGNVGVDAARTAVRLGAAQVTVVYRGTQ